MKEHKDKFDLSSYVKHISWCIIDIDGKDVKVAVTPNNRGKFKILWIEKRYDYMIDRYIDAASIKKVILKNPPDYCDDNFKFE